MFGGNAYQKGVKERYIRNAAQVPKLRCGVVKVRLRSTRGLTDEVPEKHHIVTLCDELTSVRMNAMLDAISRRTRRPLEQGQRRGLLHVRRTRAPTPSPNWRYHKSHQFDTSRRYAPSHHALRSIRYIQLLGEGAQMSISSWSNGP